MEDFSWIYSTDTLSKIFVAVVISLGVYMVKYFRKQSNVIKDLCDEIKLCKKAIIVLAKTIDTNIERTHDENPELKELVIDILKDEKKNRHESSE